MPDPTPKAAAGVDVAAVLRRLNTRVAVLGHKQPCTCFDCIGARDVLALAEEVEKLRAELAQAAHCAPRRTGPAPFRGFGRSGNIEQDEQGVPRG